jgi:parallel beta-helix repeat protein
VAGTGIFAYKSCKISGDISGNVIYKAKSSGIYLTDHASVTGSVVSNTITSPKQMGIFLSSASTVKAIKKNTITGSGKNAIDLASVKNNITISNNVIKGGSDNAILIRPGTAKYKVTITGNKLSVKPERCGVYAMSGKLSVSKNTITKNSKQIYFESGASGTIGKNSYK